MNKLKIGLLLNPDRKVDNWELRLIQSILEGPTFEICCLFTDGRTHVTQDALSSNKSKLNRFIIKVLKRIEKSRRFVSLDKSDQERLNILKGLKGLPVIKLYPKRKGFVDMFSEEDAVRVQSYNLDVLLRHEFNIIRGPILNAAKHGIWSFHHADNNVNRGGPAGFWEVLQGDDVSGVTLQRLTNELDGGLIIDKGFYNTRKLWTENNEFLLEMSVELLMKNLLSLQRLGNVVMKRSGPYSKPLMRYPSTVQLSRYFWKSLKFLMKRKLKYKFGRFKLNLHPKYNVWQLYLGKGNVEQSALWRVKEITSPKNEFWADPFMYSKEGVDYVFFENYEYDLGKAKISCGVLSGDSLVNVVDVIKTDYHLSYPHIFEYQNDLYMMPESSAKNRIEIWKCIDFPRKWELDRTVLQGESVADATTHVDESGSVWLFVNKGGNKFRDHNSHLYIYKADTLLLDNLQPHNLNPVVSDSRLARGAGNIFKGIDAQWLRPSQNNSGGVYGRSLNLSSIKKLTIDEYEEELVSQIEPEFKEGLIGVHHVTISNGYFIIDGCKKKRD
jgi:hypothetical protein